MLDLLRLAHITGDPDLAQRASELANAFSQDVARVPMGFTQLLSALDMAMGGLREVVIVGGHAAEDTEAMLQALRTSYLPNKVVLHKGLDEGDEAILRIAPFLKDHHPIDGRATAYVCEEHFCKNPTTDVGKMLEDLGQ
jgi:uncharacterized protein YyaL (SSP411 family)